VHGGAGVHALPWPLTQASTEFDPEARQTAAAPASQLQTMQLMQLEQFRFADIKAVSADWIVAAVATAVTIIADTVTLVVKDTAGSVFSLTGPANCVPRVAQVVQIGSVVGIGRGSTDITVSVEEKFGRKTTYFSQLFLADAPPTIKKLDSSEAKFDVAPVPDLPIDEQFEKIHAEAKKSSSQMHCARLAGIIVDVYETVIQKADFPARKVTIAYGPNSDQQVKVSIAGTRLVDLLHEQLAKDRACIVVTNVNIGAEAKWLGTDSRAAIFLDRTSMPTLRATLSAQSPSRRVIVRDF
jgi:hypothetical protein